MDEAPNPRDPKLPRLDVRLVEDYPLPPNADACKMTLQAVHDRESFFAFVAALGADRRASIAAEAVKPSSRYGPDAGGWENITIESFLDAALSWAESSAGLPAAPTWRDFAYFLYAGKFYE